MRDFVGGGFVNIAENPALAKPIHNAFSTHKFPYPRALDPVNAVTVNPAIRSGLSQRRS